MTAVTEARTLSVVLLAGDRGPDDPLAVQASVAGKTLVPVAGRAMLTRVLDTLAAWPRLGRVVLVAPDKPDYQQAVAASDLAAERLDWQIPQSSLSASVAAGLACAGPDRPLLLLTADHPLMDSRWLERLLDGDSRADVRIGLADWSGVMARFPGSRRTRYRFSDRSICGTNLFVFQRPAADRLLDTWQRIERERKKPWKIVGLLGWGNLARYLAGRLSLGDAFAALSRSVGVMVEPVLIDDPLAAVDVDSPADLELVNAVLGERGPTCG
ncbi:MAG: nucleotidyltransferase family protein [Wenzhouxiangella sp.]